MTNQLPDDISFERWVQYVFDHPVPEGVSTEVRQAYHEQFQAINQKILQGEAAYDELLPTPAWFEWFHQPDCDYWRESADPNRTVDYLTRLFSNVDRLVTPYTNAQIDQGLNFLTSNGASDHMFELLEAEVPLDARIACVQSFYDVYEKLYARQCDPILLSMIFGHDANINPLNLTCYMWWDNSPFYGKSGDPVTEQLDQPILDVMAKTLQINHMACQEGALHGLGHWSGKYPEFVEATIDRFLETNPDLHPALRSYALAARTGQIL